MCKSVHILQKLLLFCFMQLFSLSDEALPLPQVSKGCLRTVWNSIEPYQVRQPLYAGRKPWKSAAWAQPSPADFIFRPVNQLRTELLVTALLLMLSSISAERPRSGPPPFFWTPSPVGSGRLQTVHSLSLRAMSSNSSVCTIPARASGVSLS